MRASGLVTSIKTGAPVPDGTTVEMHLYDGNTLLGTTTTTNGEFVFQFNGNPGPYYITCDYGDEVHIHSSKVLGVAGSIDLSSLPLYFRMWDNGVLGGVLGDLAVSANNTGMHVDVAPGVAIVRGLVYDQATAEQVTIAAADTQPRIDVVALEVVPSGANLNTEGRTRLVVVKGTPGAQPVAPSLTQTTEVWQEPLAHVRVDAGVVGIASDKVTDKRGEVQVRLIEGQVLNTNLSQETKDYIESSWPGASFRRDGGNGLTGVKIVNATEGLDRRANGAGQVDLYLRDGGVTTGKLANGAVTSGKIANAAITTDHLGSATKTWIGTQWPGFTVSGTKHPSYPSNSSGTKSLSISGGLWMASSNNGSATLQIANDGVSSAKIANGAVSNAKLANLSVNNAKLATNAVTHSKIADRSILDRHMNTSRSCEYNHITFGYLRKTNTSWTEVNKAQLVLGKGQWMLFGMATVTCKAYGSGTSTFDVRLWGDGTGTGTGPGAMGWQRRTLTGGADDTFPVTSFAAPVVSSGTSTFRAGVQIRKVSGADVELMDGKAFLMAVRISY